MRLFGVVYLAEHQQPKLTRQSWLVAIGQVMSSGSVFSWLGLVFAGDADKYQGGAQ